MRQSEEEEAAAAAKSLQNIKCETPQSPLSDEKKEIG